MLKFMRNICKYWWNETDDEILPVFEQFHWTLKFIFSSSHGKLFLVLFPVLLFLVLYLKLLENTKRTVMYLKLFWYQVFVHKKLNLFDFLLAWFRLNHFTSFLHSVGRKRQSCWRHSLPLVCAHENTSFRMPCLCKRWQYKFKFVVRFPRLPQSRRVPFEIMLKVTRIRLFRVMLRNEITTMLR